MDPRTPRRKIKANGTFKENLTEFLESILSHIMQKKKLGTGLQN
jgi:hypothetical protein